jgi:hypothetical protein
VIAKAVLRGYVLEELLAFLLQDSGYTLLVHVNQDPDALCRGGNGLRVQVAEPITRRTPWVR